MAAHFDMPPAITAQVTAIKNRTMVAPCAEAYSSFVKECHAAGIAACYIDSALAHFLATDMVRLMCMIKGAPPSILAAYAPRLALIALDIESLLEDKLNAFHAEVMADVENRNKREGEKN